MVRHLPKWWNRCNWRLGSPKLDGGDVTSAGDVNQRPKRFTKGLNTVGYRFSTQKELYNIHQPYFVPMAAMGRESIYHGSPVSAIVTVACMKPILLFPSKATHPQV